MKLLLFTRTLNNGGAERQLVLLARALHRRGVPLAVMVLYGSGPFREVLERDGVPVIDLRKSGRYDLIGLFWRAAKSLRSFQPEVIYTFIGTGAIAAMLRPVVPTCALIWGVRASYIDYSGYDRFVRAIEAVTKLFARSVDAMICNSTAGKQNMIDQHYPPERLWVVPNGIDVEYYRFNADARHKWRSAWEVATTERLIGIVGRLDPLKNHEGFLDAAALLLERTGSGLRFLCVGGGSMEALSALKQRAAGLGIADRIVWAGQFSDLPAVYSAMDLLVLSSISEGFPNVIGEAMSCGLPIVATDVGDCRAIVGERGWIVPARDPAALAEGMAAAIAELDSWNPDVSRQRIERLYSVAAMVESTEAILQKVQMA